MKKKKIRERKAFRRVCDDLAFCGIWSYVCQRVSWVALQILVEKA